jgi:hypothetical protein
MVKDNRAQLGFAARTPSVIDAGTLLRKELLQNGA